MDTFRYAGAQVRVVDAADVAQLLAGATATPQAILHATGPAASAVPAITVELARETFAGQPVLRLKALIRGHGPGFGGPLHPAIVGAAYIGPLVDAISKLLDPASPASDASRPRQSTVGDERSNLSGTVSHGRPGLDGMVTDTLETVIGADGADVDTLIGFVRMTLDAAREQAGKADRDEFLAGRIFLLGPAPVSSGASSDGTADVDDDGKARLDQLGGLEGVVEQLRDVADSFRHPEVMARWGARRPQGILMWGPPGTGKTTLATALATEIGGTLREVRTPDILSKWVGSSERNIKKIFTEARGFTNPTVLLFDEFDSIISYNGAPQGAADQVSNSVAGLFKQEMNGLIDANPNVIVVATTNFPHRVDESLIRSGRFDLKISVPLPDAAGRADILTKMVTRLKRQHAHGDFEMFADDVDIAALAAASHGMSGADLKELLRRVQMAKAMQEARTGTRPTPISQQDLTTEITRLLTRH